MLCLSMHYVWCDECPKLWVSTSLYLTYMCKWLRNSHWSQLPKGWDLEPEAKQFPWENSEGICKHCKHCKPGLFDKRFCMANTAIFTSYITFQSNHHEIFHWRQMWIYELPICTFRHDKVFNFVNCSFSSPTSSLALCASIV
jgi:hypothetical protein